MASVEEVAHRQERAAKNQSLFREVNERVEDLNKRFHAFTVLSDWVCECANDECGVRIEMTVQEYEHVRSAGQRFLVASSDEHVWPDVERVVERRPNYWIVEKIEHSGAVAREIDPRSGGPVSFEG